MRGVSEMTAKLDVAFIGSSITSAYWNGAATYYRGIVRNLSAAGHRIRFFEPDAYDRQRYRDLLSPAWVDFRVFSPDQCGMSQALDLDMRADVVIKASGVGVLDNEIEACVHQLRRRETLCIYWDVDAPATIERIKNSTVDPLRSL